MRLLFTAFVFLPLSLALANDNTPPQLTAFSFSPTAINVSTSSAVVSVSVSAKDDLSGVRNFQVTFLSPNGSLQEGDSEPFAAPGQLQSTGTASITFPKSVQGGTWTVQYVNVFDEAGNGTYLSTSALAAAGFPTTLTVTGASDITPPQLTGFSFSPTTINISATSAVLSVSVSAKDDLSGVRNFQVTFLSPNSSLQEGDSEPFANPGQLQSTGTATITFPKSVQAGKWTVQSVNVFDEAGNGTYMNTSALAAAGFPTQLTVVGASDTTPPQLTSFSFSPSTIDTSTSSAVVSAALAAKDDLSGVRNFQVTFLSPNGSLQEGDSEPFANPGQLQSAGTANITFPKLVQAGIWTVQYVNVFDEAGNGTYMNTSALAAAGFPTRLTVLGTSTLSVNSLTPSSSTAGGAAFTVTVNGSGFIANCIVQWNGSALPTTYLSGTQLSASVSANLISNQGTAAITVLNPGGITSNSITFTISAPVPNISNLSPNSATAGGPAFTLVANGSGFLVGSTVQWNGSALPTTYISGTQLTTSVSASLIANQGTASVAVLNPGGMMSAAVSFAISASVPSISNLSPATATANGPAFTLTVNGSGFLVGSTVQWNGSALSTTYINGTQLGASVPTNLIASQGTASVRVLNPGGTTSNAVTFTITAPTPNISGLSPSSATAGGPSFVLTVSGSGFLVGSTVQWSGSALSTSYLSGNQLTASVPSNSIGVQGTANIVVANPGGATSNPATFTINTPVPAITTMSPISATAGGPQFTITVNGSGFLVGSVVQWNGSALPTSYTSGTQLTATVSPSLITNSGNTSIKVVNPGGAASNALTFPINPPTPAILSLSPSSAAAGGAAFTLVVNGSGFLQGSTVQWNGAALATTYASGSQLTASVPAASIANSGNASVTVANPGGTISNALTLAISVSGLSISTLSPLLTATVGVPYSQALAAAGGVTPYKNWTVVDPNDLPPGISLTTSGSLNGTPTSTGTFTFTVQVTDAANSTATKILTVTINAGAVSISASGIVNAASYAGGSVSPGEIVVIFGSGFGPDVLGGLQLDSRGYVSTSLANTQVMFDGVSAPMIYAVAGQVSVVVPYQISRKSTTQVQVVYQNQSSNIVSLPVSAVVPGVFTSDASGHGLGAIINQDGTVNSSLNPAPAGSYISVYATGEGQTDPEGVDGKPADWPAPLPFAQPVTATVGGLPAQVQYAGGAPGLVAGVFQVNLQIPQGMPPGNSVPIAINVGGQNSQANVMVAVK